MALDYLAGAVDLFLIGHGVFLIIDERLSGAFPPDHASMMRPPASPRHIICQKNWKYGRHCRIDFCEFVN